MRGRGRGPVGGRGNGGRGRFGGRGRGKFGKEGGLAENLKDGGDSVRRVGRSKVWRTSEDALEASFGYQIFTEGEPRLGWSRYVKLLLLLCVHSVSICSSASVTAQFHLRGGIA